MTVPRCLALVGFFAALGLGLVLLRSEQVRTSYRVNVLRGEFRDLSRQYAIQQMEIARLRAPEQISDRVDRMDLSVGPAEPLQDAKPAHSVADTRQPRE